MPLRFIPIKSLTVILFLALWLAGCGPAGEAGSEGVGDAYYPRLGNGGYDVGHYDLNLDIDVEDRMLRGIVSIQATAAQDLASFNLDFSDYAIESIIVNGETAGFEQDDLELTIIPSSAIREGDDFTVTIRYSGNPEEHARRNEQFSFREGLIFYEDGAYALGEPSGSAYWFPVNEHPSDKATYTFAITVPEPYEVATNGRLVKTDQNAGANTFFWEAADPMANYLVTLAIADFDVVEEQGPHGLPVRNYFHVDVPSGRRGAFDSQVEMIEYFETVFGLYPFEAYGGVMHATNQPLALETQTLSTFFPNFVFEEVIAHELAHQWFGNSVSLESWQDIWLNEGFASYAEVLWVEHSQGKEAADGMIFDFYAGAAANDQFESPPGDPGPEQLFGGQVYERGALTLHALRLHIGDEVFFEVLRSYHDRYKNGNATTDDFIGVAEEVSGQSLQDLFDVWLYQQEVPDLPQHELFREDYAGQP